MNSAFQKTIEGAVAHAMEISTVAHAMEISTLDKKGWFICYTCIGQNYFCLSPHALSAWKRIPGWFVIGVLRPDGKYKLRRGWAQLVILAKLTA